MGISLIMFACVFGGALCGMLLRATLPEHHLSADSKDIVKLGIRLVAMMAALVLTLLIASAKSSYGTPRGDLTQMAANIILLDRVLNVPQENYMKIVSRRSVRSDDYRRSPSAPHMDITPLPLALELPWRYTVMRDRALRLRS